MISVERQLAATHVDAVRALLDFLLARTSAEVIIGEGTGTGSAGTMVGFKNFGYLSLAQEYDVRLVDLNTDEPVTTHILDVNLRPLSVSLAKTVVDSDFRISICPPKTHDCVVVTASLKNMVMGSLLRRQNQVVNRFFLYGELFAKKVLGMSSSGRAPTLVANITGNNKIKVHQGYAVMNLNLYKLAKLIPPHLAIIDGLQGMEGEGPVEGEEVKLGMALASTDFVACDSLMASIMGFDISQIGYLYYSWKQGLGQGDISQIDIVGDRTETRPFKPHPAYEDQPKWQLAGVERYLD